MRRSTRRLFVALALALASLALSPLLARGSDPLTAEGVDALVEQFVGLVARAAALGESASEAGASSASSSSSSSSFSLPPLPRLDPASSAAAFFSRLLDEVLPDGAPEELRALTAEAMGVAVPAPVSSPLPSSEPTTADAANASSDADPSDPAADPSATSNLSSIAATGRKRRRSLLQNATPLSPIVAPASVLTVDRGGRFGGWSQAFQIAFSNVFDFFLRGGFGFLVPLIGDALAPLRRYNFIRDVGNSVDAPFDNVINANYFPLPQTTDELLGLLLRIIAPLCAAEKASAGSNVLGALKGMSVELELVPWTCDVLPVENDGKDKKKDGDNAPSFENLLSAKHNKSGGGWSWKDREEQKDAFEHLLAAKKNKTTWWSKKDDDRNDDDRSAFLSALLGSGQRIAWETCKPSTLALRLKPNTLNGPYYSAASYSAAACAFAQPFGLGSTLALGLDTAAIALKLSRVGIDVMPTIVQLEGSGRFFPWLATEFANNRSGNPVARELSFASAANRTTEGAGANMTTGGGGGSGVRAG